MSVALEVVSEGLNEALLKIEGLAEAPRNELMDGIGRLVQEQTRRRIEEEKTAPSGAKWQPNIAGSPLLYQSGMLSRSIDYEAGDTTVIVGSGLIYARIHQEGGTIRPRNARALFFRLGNSLLMVQSVQMPARPYLGLSPANETDIVDAAEDWLGRLIQ